MFWLLLEKCPAASCGSHRLMGGMVGGIGLIGGNLFSSKSATYTADVVAYTGYQRLVQQFPMSE